MRKEWKQAVGQVRLLPHAQRLWLTAGRVLENLDQLRRNVRDLLTLTAREYPEACDALGTIELDIEIIISKKLKKVLRELGHPNPALAVSDYSDPTIQEINRLRLTQSDACF
jgi:hypothetical protein